MSIVLERTVFQGNTFRVYATIRDFPAVGQQQGSLMDPDSITARLLDPDEAQSGGDMTPTQDGTGQYHQDVDVPVDAVEGEWSVEIEISVTGKLSSERVAFRVVA